MMTLWHGTRGILMLAKNQVASQLRRFNVHENAVYYRDGIIPKYAPWLVYWCNCTFHNIALNGIIGLPLFQPYIICRVKPPEYAQSLGFVVLFGQGPLYHDVQFSCAINQPLLAHHWRVHQCLLMSRFIAPSIPWGVSVPGGKILKQLLKDHNFLNNSPIFITESYTFNIFAFQ